MGLPINQIVCGNCLEVMQTFFSSCIDMAMFSPPYWGLRDYGKETEAIWGGNPSCQHEWQSIKIIQDNLRFRDKKHEAQVSNQANEAIFSNPKVKQNICVHCNAWQGQLGLEPHPLMYIEHMVSICNEVKRIMKSSGSLYLNLGDIYYSSSGGKETKNPKRSIGFRRKDIENSNWLQPKQLLGMPWRITIALQNEGWILRNAIIWYKPNHMPSSVKDRLTSAYEHIFHFVKSRKYYYDLDAIRQPHKAGTMARAKRQSFPNLKRIETLVQNPQTTDRGKGTMQPNLLGKNPSDIIKCKESSGIYSFGSKSLPASLRVDASRSGHGTHRKGRNPGDFWVINTKPCPEAHFAVYPIAICEQPIKSSCPRDGIVLDPMCGSGTTLIASQELGRKWIGIELNPKYVEMAKKRLRKECSRKLMDFMG